MSRKADVIDDVSKQMLFIAFFGCFLGSAYANDHLRPKVRYENDRKNMEDLLVHKWEKMLISDQKIHEVANANPPLFSPIAVWTVR